MIGVLLTQSADHYKIEIVAFLQSLKEAGFLAGQNVAVEYRHADNQYDRLPTLAADLVRRRVAVIVAEGAAPALAARAATTTIPIVFTTGSDPVAVGLVASLNRPGANVTGITSLTADLSQKRLQLLRELLPNAAVFGVLVGATSVSTITALQAAARTLGLSLARGRTAIRFVSVLWTHMFSTRNFILCHMTFRVTLRRSRRWLPIRLFSLVEVQFRRGI